jgi:hypothetical protein
MHSNSISYSRTTVDELNTEHAWLQWIPCMCGWIHTLVIIKDLLSCAEGGAARRGGELFRDDWLLVLSSTWTNSLTFKNLKVAAAAAAIPQILLQNSTKNIIRCVYKTASYVASRTAWSRACNVVGLGSRGSGQMFCICCKIWDYQQH